MGNPLVRISAVSRFAYLVLVACFAPYILLNVSIPATAQPTPDWKRRQADQHLVPRNSVTSPGRVSRCNPPVIDTNSAPRGKVCGAWKSEQRITHRAGLGLSAQCLVTIRTCTAFINRRVAR